MQLTQTYTPNSKTEDQSGNWSLRLVPPAEGAAIKQLSQAGANGALVMSLTDQTIIPALDITKPVTVTISQ